jgi:hypothetical protein
MTALRDQMTALVTAAVNLLENTPHDTLNGLRQRYYYRGGFILLEHLSPKALASNIARLRQRGKHEHAERLRTWMASRRHGAPDMDGAP